jgi:putative membrane-bound dehydrogenase-like protein
LWSNDVIDRATVNPNIRLSFFTPTPSPQEISMTRFLFLFPAALALCAVAAHAQGPAKSVASKVKPLKVLLVTGGCCHDYKHQKDILKEGLEARANVIVDQMHSDDSSTKCRFEKYNSPNWADGYDVVIHDECAADITDVDYINNILAPHKNGTPAVNLHCTMHCYRVSPDFGKPTIKPGTEGAMWFDFTGIQSSAHGAQKPIALTFLPTDHPITKGMTDWTTINEELYNNIQIFDTATPLVRGKQDAGNRPGVNDTVVAWTNLYGDKKTRVFSTTLGHNNVTVGDDRYLNLVVRGMLWACDKLNDDYLKPYDASKAKPADPNAGPQPTPAKSADSKGDGKTGDAKNPAADTTKTSDAAAPAGASVVAAKSSTAESRAAAATGVKAPPGFETTLFAGPPDVNYPTCLSSTPDGVLFVGCDENGSLDAKPDRGRIVRCIDRDGDGVADEFTVFTRLDSPRGVIADGNAVYVLHPPKLSVYFDTDGDGVADQEKTLVDGIGHDLSFRGADHTTNGIRLGIDGYIYIACGDYGFMKATGTDGVSLQLHGGGVVRVRTDGSGLEIVSHGQRNIYDVAVDPWLNLYTRDNTNDGGGWDVRLSHVVAGANFGYPSLFKNFGDEIIQPLADYGGGAPTGALFVDEGSLPTPYNRALYTVEWGRSAVLRHPLNPTGSTFKVSQERFLGLPQPTDIDVDAAGRMYVSSWKGASFTYVGPNVGYIARVTATDQKQQKVPDISLSSDADLVKLIGGDSHVLRLAAQRELLRRTNVTQIAIESLKQIVGAQSDLAPRVAALYTVSQLQRADAEADLLRWMKNDDLREFAIRALGEQRGGASPAAAEAFVDALSDANPRVRLQAVTALVRMQKTDAAGALVPLVADSDPIVAHVTRNGLATLAAGSALFSGLDHGPAPIAAGCLIALQQMHDPDVVDGLIARLAKLTDLPTKKLYLSALCRLCLREADWDGRWWGTRPDTTGPYFKPTAWEKTTQIQQLLADLFAHSEPDLRFWLLNEAQRNRVDLPGATAEVLKLAQNDPTFRPEAARLLAGLSTWSDEAVKLIVDVAKDSSQPVKIRTELIQQLVKRADVPAARQGAFRAVAAIGLTNNGDGLRQVRNDYLNGAANGGQWKTLVDNVATGGPEERELTYAALLKLTQRLRAPAEAKAAAAKLFDAAWSKPDTSAELLRAIGATGADQFGYQVQSYRKNSDPAVSQAAEFAAAELRLDENTKNKVLIEKLTYEDVVAQAEQIKGDSALGAKLFVKQGCANCHTTAPGEPPKGPFLGGISTRYKRFELCESILKPSAKIAQGFDTYSFLLDDGRAFDGFITRESGDEVEIRGANGIPRTIPISTIEQRTKRAESIMPNGLVDKLSTDDLAAILAYLESLPAK